MITETLAFHDRRTENKNDETVEPTKPGRTPNMKADYTKTHNPPPAKGNEDPSFNSKFRPQGSLFVELYHPWTALEPRTSDLATVDPQTQIAGVELTKLTPLVNGKQSPVWRLVIVNPSAQNAAVAGNPTGDELPNPEDPIVNNRPTIERAAYFVASLPNYLFPTAKTDRQGPNVSYYPSAASSIIVPPSGYAVVGSGDSKAQNRTYIGFENGKRSGSSGSTRMVTLNPTDLADARVVRNTHDPVPPAGTPIPKVLAINYATPAGNGNNQTQRLSVSEPTDGYVPYEKEPKMGPQTVNANGEYPKTFDIPVDQNRTLPPHNETFAGKPIWQWLNADGTIPGFRIIYLQRLADPTRPWSPDVPMAGTPPTDSRMWNPYRTVDAMTVDLTTFNGVYSPTSEDPTAANGGTWNGHFEARQRGEKNFLPGNPPPQLLGEVNLWKQEPAVKGKTTAGTSPTPWPAGPLGWQTSKWSSDITPGLSPTSTTMYFKQGLLQTLGYLNTPFSPQGGANQTASSGGDPQFPFPWLNWSYRPFNNVYELLLVPALPSSRLLARSKASGSQGMSLAPGGRRYFSYVDKTLRGTPPQGFAQGYDGSASPQVPYPHLLNFFESGQGSKGAFPNPGPSIQPMLRSQLHRVLAYVCVPSRFANSQLQIPPLNASFNSKTTPGGQPYYHHLFHTPFNRVSNFREPGLMNANMFTSADVLLGAMNIYFPPLVVPQPNSSPQNPVQPPWPHVNRLNPDFWDKFVRSRRQGGITDPKLIGNANPVSPVVNGVSWPSLQATTQQTLANMLRINPNLPSRFMRPYRTPGGAALATPTAGGQSTEPNRETDVTLLRGDPDIPVRPLFQVDDFLMGTANSPSSVPATPDNFGADVPLFQPSGLACMDFNRNPYFRYQAIEKLGSALSTHSNVFAIWITVGYFQVLPAANPKMTDPQGNLVYPDGYQLGAELGSDTGDIVRHRAFYIFDRSIPVGFLRGQDLNDARALLVKRFIE